MARVTISDVAASAGVSVATVSLVLNNANARISEATRRRVREAAAASGYRPSSLARSLKTKRTRTIGMISDEIAATPYAGRMLAGAQEAAREHGYLLFLVDTGADVAVERDAIRALAAHQVDAMIYACMWHRVVEVPQELSRDTVLLDCRTDGGTHRSVVPDEYGGGAAAARLLLEAGHERIAFVGPSGPQLVAASLRWEGFRAEIAAAGIETREGWHVLDEISAVGGRRATDALLDLPDAERPTGIFYFNDRMAAGGYAAAHRRGLTIPDDLSIVGFDDQQLVAAEQDPPLTTIALPHAQMGRWAMEVAMGVRTPEGSDAQHLMQCRVVRRDSVAPPPATVCQPSRRRGHHHTERSSQTTSDT